LKPVHLFLLILLASFWGGSFLFIRLAVPDFGVAPLAAARSSIAALTLMPLVLIGSRRAEFLRHWKVLAVVGLISTALPVLLLTISTRYTSAGYASILNALTPLFSALLAWLWLKEGLSRSAVIGIILGFCGVLVMVLDRETIASSLPLLPVLAGVGATFFYGLTANFSRRYLRGISSVTVAAGSQVFAGLFLLTLALPQWPAAPLPALSWVYAAILGIVCTGMAYMVFFHLIEQVGVARTVVVTYLVPVFALLWGSLILHETITMQMLGGAALILTGIGLTTRPS